MAKPNFKLGFRDDGLTPLYLAIKHGRTKIVQRLLKKGANYVILNSHKTPLYLVIFKGHTDAVIKLLKYRADINIQ